MDKKKVGEKQDQMGGRSRLGLMPHAAKSLGLLNRGRGRMERGVGD